MLIEFITLGAIISQLMPLSFSLLVLLTYISSAAVCDILPASACTPDDRRARAISLPPRDIAFATTMLTVSPRLHRHGTPLP